MGDEMTFPTLRISEIVSCSDELRCGGVAHDVYVCVRACSFRVCGRVAVCP